MMLYHIRPSYSLYHIFYIAPNCSTHNIPQSHYSVSCMPARDPISNGSK